MPQSSAAEELQTLRARLDEIAGVETIAARPGDASEGRFQGYVAMRVENQPTVERLLAHLGDTDSCRCIFHVGEQKCELGFRVEVTTSQDALRYALRFWGLSRVGPAPHPPLPRPPDRRGRRPRRTSLPGVA